MLRMSDITLRRGARVLFEHASLNVHPGQKVGLVGPNGSGKSSLVALVRGELHADAGEVSLPPRWVLSHVAQETPAVERAALEFVIDGDEELREVEEAIASAEEAAHRPDPHPGPLPKERESAGERLAELHARYGEIGGYQARARAQTLLAGLGFSEEDQPLAVAHSRAAGAAGWRSARR
jgi:ATP-binding cassette subfamily F protein 3